MKEQPDPKKIIQDEINESVGKVSAEFMSIATVLKGAGVGESVSAQFDGLFKIWMKSNQTVSSTANKLSEQLRKLRSELERTQVEKRRLEALFTSGIQFTSETEMKSLLGVAIDTVIKELKADAGFIVLVNDQTEIEQIVARNMDPDENPDATDLSTSVINSTVSSSEPTTMADMEQIDQDSQVGSIVRLGIKSVLCVPLISTKRVIGAVYLDRRNTATDFDESDLVFLLSFSRQIVRGLEISEEISLLESKLLLEAQLKFEDLRNEFACEEIVGSSKELFEVVRMAARVAPTNASVLILGENGTGKELVAHAIHNNSRRANGPFVAINCGAIPADLLESELFGYEAGAFTGATKSKPGKIETADGGTLFLDEIGELSVNLQAKLLRILQSKEIERLGSVKTHKIDVRILAATNRNLGDMVKNGDFREDLYYRLKVIEITVPPLRTRIDDIQELSEFFLKKHAPDTSLTLSDAALDILENYNWPGNVRELENVILRGVVLAKYSEIGADELPPELVEADSETPSVQRGQKLADAEAEFRKSYILKTLRDTSSKSEAARLLGVNRTHFYRMLAQLGIE